MELFAHLTDIICVSLGRPNKSLFFSGIEIIHLSPWCKIISIIVIQTQQPIPHQHLGGLKAGCLEAGMLFNHYKMSVLEHHLTHSLKNNNEKSIPYWPTFWFKCVRYRTLPVNSSQGKNVIRTAKKVSMTTMDQINQLTVASYLREDVWPTCKMLPKSWSKWRHDKRSLCQMILNKVAVPAGVDPKSYCDAMLLGITNDKYCSLRSNFKQVMFEQFQGKLCNKIHVTYWFMLTSL